MVSLSSQLHILHLVHLRVSSTKMSWVNQAHSIRHIGLSLSLRERTLPKEVDSDSEVIQLISNNPDLIGYIDKSSVTDSVKVIGEF